MFAGMLLLAAVATRGTDETFNKRVTSELGLSKIEANRR
jgi:hypothetical protein